MREASGVVVVGGYKNYHEGALPSTGKGVRDVGPECREG